MFARLGITLSGYRKMIFIYTLLFLVATLVYAENNNPALINNYRSCSVLKHNYPQYSNITALGSAALPQNFCASVYNSNTGNVRGLLYLANSNALLSVVPSKGVYWNYDANNDGKIDSNENELQLIIAQADLNHGIAYSEQYNKLYASSDSTVYAWDFTDQIPPTINNKQTIINSIPSGGHSTRSLLMDDTTHFLYVSVGSASNVDADSTTRSLIRRFNVEPSMIPSDGYSFSTGELFANGLRNEVGLTLDKYNSLWGVMNGADNLNRADLGGEGIHQNNPAEDLHHFDQGVGRFYGYPYCFTEYSIPSENGGLGRGTKWAWTADDASHNDAWCRNTNNVVPPDLAMQGHSAPLSLKFYDISSGVFSFPANYSNQLFIGFHGSWNRSPPTGYKLVTVPISDTGSSLQVSSDSFGLDFFRHNSNEDDWDFRPVDLAIGKQGEMYLSNDGGNSAKIIVIRYMAGDISSGPDIADTPPSATSNANSNYYSQANLCWLFCIAVQFLAIFLYSSF